MIGSSGGSKTNNVAIAVERFLTHLEFQTFFKCSLIGTQTRSRSKFVMDELSRERELTVSRSFSEKSVSFKEKSYK